MVQFALQLVPLVGQAIDHPLDVIDLVVIIESISVETLDLIFEDPDLFMSHVLFLLHLFAKGELSGQIVL